mmetsp:Transcript_15425/g.23729  ORF Transcript_15425/g.23729 Transcript_15425/m.23729 type:complete len:131 (-) Transcript_15425:749-1141(-)
MEQEETITFQDHQVCTECKFHSHCKLFNPLSTCRADENTNADGTAYKIGNPLTPSIASHGFEDWNRDEGRVTDGEIRGDSCDCEFSHYLSDAADQEGQQYTVYPTLRMTDDEMSTCKLCYQNDSKSEQDC